MTLEAYSSLPFTAGGAVATAAGRGVLWAAGIYMREPARNTAVAALLGLSILAGGNALYKQAHHHPAPLFGSFESSPAQVVRAKPVRPVLPVDRPARLGIDTTETTGSLAAPAVTPAAAAAIGNDEVLALQKKLAALNFFSGTADGLFGPRTARAIKAFEQSLNRPQRGLLTQQMVDLVLATPLPVRPAASASVASISSAPQPLPAAVKAQTPLTLVAPTPLIAGRSNADPVAPASSASAPPSATSQVATLEQGTGAETLPMNEAPAVPKRVVQTIAVHADTGQPMPTALPSGQQGDDASTDPDTVAAVQRGLNSLGFLHGEIDGVAGEATAKAIRNFEVFYNYEVTGRITRGLVDLLTDNGATI
jgi:peptidoglycan hydrolase-like protein with peptidoglycan-binding domain